MTNTGPHQFEMEDWISCSPFERLLNMEIVEAAEGRAILTMPFIVELAQGAGLMHGGALVSLADTAMVMAIKSIVDPMTHFATISLESRFLYPVIKGVITAKAYVKAEKERFFKGQVSLFDENQREVMQAASMFKIAAQAKIKGITFVSETDNK
jgi:acyl-CoA thioesterase